MATSLTSALIQLLADPGWAGSAVDQARGGAITSARLVCNALTDDSVDAVAVLLADPLASTLSSLDLRLDGSLATYDSSIATLALGAPSTLAHVLIHTTLEVAVGAFAAASAIKHLEIPGWIADPDDVEPEEAEDVLCAEELTVHEATESTAAHLSRMQWPRLKRLTLHHPPGPRGLRALLRPHRTPALEELSFLGASAALPWAARLHNDGVLARLRVVRFSDEEPSADHLEERCMHCGDTCEASWMCTGCCAMVCRGCRAPDGPVEMCIDCVPPEEPPWLRNVTRHGRRSTDGRLPST